MCTRFSRRLKFHKFSLTPVFRNDRNGERQGGQDWRGHFSVHEKPK